MATENEYMSAEDVESLSATIDRFEKCFVRIAKAHGLTPLCLMAMAANNEESYAEILARYIEQQMETQE